MIGITDLDFGYPDKPLFDGLQLGLERGHIYGLLGLNGAGKSTLLKLLCGLLFAQAGTLRVLDQDPGRREPDFLSRLFLLPEGFQLPAVTGQRYVRDLAPFYPGFDAELLKRYLHELALSPADILSDLSHGQQKKFLLAFGLASGASLLLLDEPTNGLDIPAKGQFRRLVAEALTEDRTFIVSTHQVADIESLIDGVVMLHDGRVMFERSLADLTEVLHMQRSTAAHDKSSPGLLYQEACVGGYWSIWSGGDDSGQINLEVLFNAVIAQPERFAPLMNTNGASQ